MLSIAQENMLPLSTALTKAIDETSDEHLAHFYEWVKRKYGPCDYDKIRAGYANAIDPKFLAICARTRSLMSIAKWASWHTKSNLRTLDLGCGPGHMGLIANFFGHASLGLDKTELFVPLRQFWTQAATLHNIEAGKPLPPVGKFHTITSILTNYGRAWSTEEWRDFLNRLMTDHLEPGGEFVLSFPGNPSLEYRKYLRQKATRTEADGRLMFFTQD